MPETNIKISECLMEFRVKKRGGNGGEERPEKGIESLKHLKHPSEIFLGFPSLVLTKPSLSERGGGGGDSIIVRGSLRLMPSEYA